MLGDFDSVEEGFGSDKFLVEELAMANILKIVNHPKFNDVVDVEDLQVIKNYVKYYVKSSTAKMQQRMDMDEKQRENEKKRRKR